MSNKSIDKLAQQTQHTPGPWYVGRHTTGLYIQFDHGPIKEATICAMNTPCMAYSNAANDARLIAAAPELLAACKTSLEKLKHGYADPKEISQHIATLEAVIAHAEGR